MLKDELEALPGKMAALEDEQHTLEDRLNDPGFFARDPDGFNATAKRISELDDRADRRSPALGGCRVPHCRTGRQGRRQVEPLGRENFSEERGNPTLFPALPKPHPSLSKELCAY